MSGRTWTRDDKRLLRRRYGVDPTAALAGRLGRTAKAVYLMAVKLRPSTRRMRWTPRADAKLRRLNAAGLPDGRVAAELRCDRHTVAGRRKALGLPSNQHGHHAANRLREKATEQLGRLGLRSMGELRVKAWGDLAERYGLPRELNPTAVRVVLALAGGPMTRRQIVAALGRAWKTANGGRNNLSAAKKPGGSYPGWLVSLGLIARVPRYERSGRRGTTQRESVYVLTAAATDRLAAAGKGADRG